jgi:phage-related protein
MDVLPLFVALTAVAVQQNIIDDSIQNVQNWFNSITEWAWHSLADGILWVWHQIASLFEGIINATKNSIMNVITTLGQVVTDIINGIANPFRALFAGFSSVVNSAVQSVVSFVGGNPLIATLYFVVIPAIIVVVVAILWRGGRKAIGI